MREVRQVEEEIAQRCLDAIELAFEPLRFVSDARDFREQSGSVLTLPLGRADRLRKRVALRLQLLRAHLDVLALAFERLEARRVERDAALAEALDDRSEIVAQKMYVEHGPILANGPFRT